MAAWYVRWSAATRRRCGFRRSTVAGPRFDSPRGQRTIFQARRASPWPRFAPHRARFAPPRRQRMIFQARSGLHRARFAPIWGQKMIFQARSGPHWPRFASPWGQKMIFQARKTVPVRGRIAVTRFKTRSCVYVSSHFRGDLTPKHWVNSTFRATDPTLSDMPEAVGCRRPCLQGCRLGQGEFLRNRGEQARSSGSPRPPCQ